MHAHGLNDLSSRAVKQYRRDSEQQLQSKISDRRVGRKPS